MKPINNKFLKGLIGFGKGLLKGTDSLILSGAITNIVEETKKSVQNKLSLNEGGHILIRLIPILLLVGAALGYWSINDLRDIVRALVPFLG